MTAGPIGTGFGPTSQCASVLLATPIKRAASSFERPRSLKTPRCSTGVIGSNGGCKGDLSGGSSVMRPVCHEIQIQSATKMQIQMIDHIMESWEAQMKSPHPMAQVPSEILAKLQSWPGLNAAGGWPGADSFNGMSADPMRFWSQLGEQWQKNWAQMMTQLSATAAPPAQRKKRENKDT